MTKFSFPFTNNSKISFKSLSLFQTHMSYTIKKNTQQNSIRKHFFSYQALRSLKIHWTNVRNDLSSQFPFVPPARTKRHLSTFIATPFSIAQITFPRDLTALDFRGLVPSFICYSMVWGVKLFWHISLSNSPENFYGNWVRADMHKLVYLLCKLIDEVHDKSQRYQSQ